MGTHREHLREQVKLLNHKNLSSQKAACSHVPTRNIYPIGKFTLKREKSKLSKVPYRVLFFSGNSGNKSIFDT